MNNEAQVEMGSLRLQLARSDKPHSHPSLKIDKIKSFKYHIFYSHTMARKGFCAYFHKIAANL